MGVIEGGLYLVELGRSGKQLYLRNPKHGISRSGSPASPQRLMVRLALKQKYFKAFSDVSILMKQFPNQLGGVVFEHQ